MNIIIWLGEKTIYLLKRNLNEDHGEDYKTYDGDNNLAVYTVFSICKPI